MLQIQNKQENFKHVFIFSLSTLYKDHMKLFLYSILS